MSLAALHRHFGAHNNHSMIHETHEAKTLSLFRSEYCLSNKDLAKLVGKGYRKAISKLRTRGVVISNHRLSKNIGNNEGTVYILDRDNEEVSKVWKNGYFSLDRSRPLEITELENGIARMYEIGRKERSMWQKFKDLFF